MQNRRRFRYLKHMADVEFEAYGKDMKEALENAAVAILGITLDTRKISELGSPDKYVPISEKADTIEKLVWFVLQDIVTQRSSRYLNAFDFKVDVFEERRGRFTLKGRLIYKDIGRDYTLLDVKAVTPSGLTASESKRRCTIRAIVDV